jgi:hypothetical protein
MGMATAPIVFTSLRDNAGGCTTGGTVAPAYHDWKGITLNASGSTFDHCGFYYAGGSDQAALDVGSGNQVTVTNSSFAHDQGPTDNGFSSAAALDVSRATAGTVVKGNVFYDNRLPVRISPNFSLDDDTNAFDNHVAAPASPQPNKYNGIDFIGDCNNQIASNITWSATAVPFVIGTASSAGLCIDTGGQLTLGSNVTLKFLTAGLLQVGSTGTLTTSSGDVFTSAKDDAHGGDTNGDQSASSPAPQDWAGISLKANGMTFDRCGIYYAGASDAAALNLNSVQATVTHSIFAHNHGPTDSFNAAPALDASGSPAGTSIKSNVFYDNWLPLRIGPSVSLNDSNFFDNTGAAPMNPQPNKYNGIDFLGTNGCNQSIQSMVTWSATKVPFVVGNPSAMDLCVDTGGQLTLVANVILKFFTGGHLRTNSNGTLTTDSSDVFTSIKDPTHGGNSDPGSSAPAAGDWSGIVENSVCETWSNIYYSTAGCP